MGVPNKKVCMQACSTADNCDFYVFIDSIPFNMGQGRNCWCGEYKKPLNAIPLDPLDDITDVTLNFKKGESLSHTTITNPELKLA